MTVKKLIGALILALGFSSPSFAQFNSVCGPPTVCVSPDTLTFAVLKTPNFTVTSAAVIQGTLNVSGTTTLAGAVTFSSSVIASAIGPTSARQHTIPSVTSDTFELLNAAQTVTNKSISGSANTLTNIPNSALTSSSLTVTAGTGMSGGGTVSLGGSITLTNTGVTSLAGTASQISASASTGAVTLSLVGPYTPATYTSNGILYGAGTSSIGVTAQGASGTVLHGNGGTPTFAAVSLTADVSGVLPLANGGTNGSPTASNGGIFYSTATAGAILAGTATAGQVLRSGASGAPSWSTATYPATAGSSNNALVSDGTNFASTAIVNSITGTANQVTASASTGGVTLSLPQSINTTASPSFTKVTLGAASGTTGSIDFKGTTSGTITLTTAAAAGTWTLTMPNTSGTSGFVLQTDGTGITSWVANGSGGNVTSVAGTANQIAVSASTGAVTFSLVGPYTPATYAANGVLYGNTTSSIGATAAGSAGQILRAGPTPAWTTATYPATATSTNQALVADGTNWVSTAIVNSITGTANQVTASASTGGVTLSLPQSINTTASPSFTKVTLGAASGTTGSIDFKGTTSGTITLTTAAAAGTWTLTMPNTSGTSGQFLQTNGSGVTTWATASGSSSGFPVPGGRLTTETGVPISTTDRTSQATIYYTPYTNNQVWTYDSSTWTYHVFSEQSLSITVTSGNNYDVFEVAGTSIELSAAWTNNTTRSDALARQDGVWVKSSDHSRLWLGTIRASGTNVTADSIGGATTQVGGQGFVCNYYNAVLRPLRVIDTTATWSYTTATIRQADAASGNKVEAVFCDAGQAATATVTGSITLVGQTGGARASVGIGVDSTTAYSGTRTTGFNASAVSAIIMGLQGQYSASPGLGYHYFAWCESGANSTSTFAGHEENDQAGLTVFTFR